MRANELSEAIKSQVTIPMAVRKYCSVPPRHNRIPCPIHGGADYNLGYNDRLYHCFVCNDGGDVIRFVQHYFGKTFPEACSQLNSDFGLNLPIDRKMTLGERMQINKAVAEAEAKRLRFERLNEEYEQLWDNWCACDYIVLHVDPERPEYAQALKQRNYYSQLIDERGIPIE